MWLDVSIKEKVGGEMEKGGEDKDNDDKDKEEDICIVTKYCALNRAGC